MNKMKLPPEVQFPQGIRLLIYRPRGLIDEAAINEIISVIEDLEAATHEPFNRFSDTLSAHEVELNFKYIIQVSLHRRLAYAGRPPLKSAILATDATTIHYGRLHALLTQGSRIGRLRWQNT
jgi:copper homeostasis protein CutC